MANSKIKKVLIANRGEIALRIQRAAHKLGIKTVSICSEADKTSLFARKADELVLVGPPPAKDSYLAIDKILKAANDTGCDAIHPGYGFLSENSEFAERIEKAGLIFIGPTSEQIRVLGSKTEARKKVEEFGVPVVPGSGDDLGDDGLLERAALVGFPLIIKAVAGGGGRGMRVVRSIQEMKEALPRARGEAKKNFSNEAVFFEKYIENPRHVEVQIMGDAHGTVLHFGTRDCSSQRRHQKLIEEAPAPGLPPQLREKIHNAAVNAGKSVGYWNAGTAEFLVKGNDFYFLEMNTRIQVEHPITEEVTGVDLVELQFKVAMGEKLPFKQEKVTFSGHAMEFRIYAEDPENNFSPTKGRIQKMTRPKGEGIREDYAFEEGDDVTLFYDAMLSKLIVTGASRSEVISRSLSALTDYRIGGLTTNLEFHRWLLRERAFRKDLIDIGFIEREFNAEKIKELRAREKKDPLHRKPVSGAEVKDHFEYQSKQFQFSYSVEIVHREDGTFLASPVSPEGRKVFPMCKRRSNGLTTALRSLIDDVLERIPPGEIFYDS